MRRILQRTSSKNSPKTHCSNCAIYRGVTGVEPRGGVLASTQPTARKLLLRHLDALWAAALTALDSIESPNVLTHLYL